MAQRQTHYDILGISHTASATEVKSAYRKAARLTHPDHGGNAEDFARATLAYETLIDSEARTRYDRSYGTKSSHLRGGAAAPETQDSAYSGATGNGSMRFGTGGRTPSATAATSYLPPLDQSGAVDRATSLRKVHGTPRKRGIFGAQARLARENRTVALLEKQLLSVLPSARLVNGLHAPSGGYIDHALLGGYRLALVHSMMLPKGVYRWDGSSLLRDGKHIAPPQLSPVVHQMQRLFPELNVTGWTVILSPDGNLHEPVIDYARGGEPGPMNVLNVVNAVKLVREMKMFLGTGPAPHVVDRTILARLLGGMH